MTLECPLFELIALHSHGSFLLQPNAILGVIRSFSPNRWPYGRSPAQHAARWLFVEENLYTPANPKTFLDQELCLL